MLDYLIFRCYWQHNSNQHQAGGKKSKSDAHYGPLALLLFTGLSLFSLQPEMSTPGHVRRLLWLRGILWSLSDLDYRAERHWVGEESWQIYQGTAPTSFQDYSGGREWSKSQQSSKEIFLTYMNLNTIFQNMYLHRITLNGTSVTYLCISYKVQVSINFHFNKPTIFNV